MNSSSQSQKIFAVGGAHIDRRGQMATDFVPGASIPGTMREEIGGGAFNALRIAVRRGVTATLMSVRGGDGPGARVAEAIAQEGIEDASAIFLDRSTPSYTALLDRTGDVVAALADMGLYELAFPKQMRRSKVREAIARHDAILTDANLPETALARLIACADGRPVYAIAISPAKAIRLTELLPSLTCLFMNRREAAALAALPVHADPRSIVSALAARGIVRVVITHGGDAAIVFHEGRLWTVTPPRPRRIVDVTGAGDAIAGATVAALLRGAPFIEAVREGIAAAMLAVETASAVPEFTPEEFSGALALVPEPVEVAMSGAASGATR